MQFEVNALRVTGLDLLKTSTEGADLLVQLSRGPKVVLSQPARVLDKSGTVSWEGSSGLLALVCTLYSSKKSEGSFSEKTFTVRLLQSQACCTRLRLAPRPPR